MIIEGGLIAIGILALIAAMFLLRGKGKTSQPEQQEVQKSAVDKQAADLAMPSVLPKTQAAPFPAPQVPFPVSVGNKQMADLAEPTILSNTQFRSPVPQVPFPVSAGNSQTADLAEPTLLPNTPRVVLVPSSDKQVESYQTTRPNFPVEATALVTQPPVWGIQPRQAQAELSQPSQTQVAVALNGQLAAKQTDQTLPEAQTQPSVSSASLSSDITPLPPLNPVSRLLSNPPSIDQQMAELMADTWALQQQAAKIARRLNYLSTYIQHSQASTPDNLDANSRS